MIRIDLYPSWRVRLVRRVELPMTAAAAWHHLRDFGRFACMDLFHRRVEFLDGRGREGREFRLPHGLPGLEIIRHGRILQWREGRGYAFSDLSRHGPRRGFPHVYRYALFPRPGGRSIFHLEVTGLWTLRWLPRALVAAWLGLVLRKTARSIETALLCCEWRARRASQGDAADGPTTASSAARPRPSAPAPATRAGRPS